MRHLNSYLVLAALFFSCFCMLYSCADKGFENGDSTYISAPTGLRTSVSGFNIKLEFGFKRQQIQRVLFSILF